MTEPAIRSANLSDILALVRIYNHYVAETHFTFDTEPSTESERRVWMDQFSNEGPHQLLVAQRRLYADLLARLRREPAVHRAWRTESLEAIIRRVP